MSRLDLVVGPNGAGKSTFVRFVLAPNRPGVPFVNADVIARERWPGAPEVHSYEAAQIAAAARSAMIAAGEELIAETVFSHPSKVGLVREAAAAGYQVNLHVLMVPVDLSVARVAVRAALGLHDVPVEKIRSRYARLWAHIAEAAPGCHRATFWDNSGDRPRLVGAMAEGHWTRRPGWPSWTHTDLLAL